MKNRILVQKMEQIDTNLCKTYDEAFYADKISEYKSILLYQKLFYLEAMIDVIKDKVKNERNFWNKIMPILEILKIPVFTIGVITSILSSPYWLVLILGEVIVGILASKGYQNSNKNVEYFSLKIDGLINMLENTDNIIISKKEREVPELERPLSEAITPTLEAQLFLNNFLLAGQKGELSIQAEEKVVRMLQEEFHTSESDLDVLLMMSKKKMSESILQNTEGLTLRRRKFK